MTNGMPAGNGDSPPSPPNCLRQLQDVIQRGHHWLFVSDREPVRTLFRCVAEMMRTGGAPASAAFALDIDHSLMRTQEQTSVTLLVLAKHLLSAREAVDFVGPIAAADIARGKDFFIISASPRALVALMDDIARGRCSVVNPGDN